MKSLKMFAIAVMAFAVMATGVHAANPIKGVKNTAGYADLKACLTAPGETKCTLTATTNLDATGNVTVSKDMTIVTDGFGLSINHDLTIDEGVKLTISGGNVKFNTASVKVTLKDGSTLLVTGNDSKAYNPVTISANVTFDVKDNATLSVSDNAKTKTGGLVVDANGTGSTINLSYAHLIINNNSGNGMQAAEVLTVVADHSDITANNNTSGGISADFTLTHNSTVSATGNGYSGVVLGTTSVDSTSTIEASDNLKSTDPIVNKKADILLQGATTVNGGTIKGGSVAPITVTWNNHVGTIGNNAALNVSGNNVSFTELKKVCEAQGALTCTDGVDISTKIHAINTKSAVIKVGKTGYVYGTAEEVTTDNTVDEVVVTEGAAISKVSVANGTKITNMSTTRSVLAHITGENSLVEIPKATTNEDGDVVPATTTLGTRPAEDTPGTGDQNTGDDANTPADGTTGRLPDEPAKTNDNILVYAGLGLVSALAVSFSAKRKENN